MLRHKGLSCSCCTPLTEETLFCAPVSEGSLARRAVDRMALSILLTAKADEETEGESGGDEWLDEEVALAVLLALLVFNRGKALRGPLDDLFATQNASPAKIEDALETFAKGMGKELDADEFAEIRNTVGRLINTGAGQVQNAATGRLSSTAGTNTVIADYATVQTAESFLTRATVDAVLRYTERFIVPRLLREITAIQNATGALDALDFSGMTDILSSRLTSTAYWDVVANSTASRAYHYGLLKAASVQRFRVYQFVAVIDERTTPICRSMNGRRFSIATALDRMEQAFEGDVDDMIELLPWSTDDEGIEESDEATLSAAGILIPPLHARCRSTIRLVS